MIHPSADSRWVFALVTPVQLQETGGGQADWYYARMSLFRGGREVERAEVGSNAIVAFGAGRVAARSSEVYSIVFRINTDDFDDITLTLGFGDVKDGRQFTVDVPLSTFTDVGVSPVPLSIPTHRIERQ